MNNRKYNIFFDLHTVSGIVISAALYIIFFAGAFALFEHEIHEWEETHEQVTVMPQQYDGRVATLTLLDYDAVLEQLKNEGHYLSGRNISFMLTGTSDIISVYLTGSSDSLASEKDKESLPLTYDTVNKKFFTEESHFSLGHFLVELHYFEQLGDFGYYTAGVVSLLFLFAIITGVLVHWKKIISNFFVFRPWSKLKTVWTDAHTVLGLIGLPYQFLYAVSGAYFCLGILVYTPKMFLYDDNRQAYSKDFNLWPGFPAGEPTEDVPGINEYIENIREQWGDYQPTYVALSNYANTNMHVQIDGRLTTQERFFGLGTIIYKTATNEVVKENNPYDIDYADQVAKSAYMLHFGEFRDMVSREAELFYRMIYFLLAIITCFVIITGVLIWVTARDKKGVSAKRKRFNETVGNSYLAICLSMFPVTAVGFLASKFLPESIHDNREFVVSSIYFGLWLLLSLFFTFRKSNYFTNKYTLLSGSILGLLIPITNGIVTGNWFWHMLQIRQYNLFLIDFIWIILSVSGLFTVYKINKTQQKKVHV
jgi:uncharacterized iron-regulated membrane protein